MLYKSVTVDFSLTKKSYVTVYTLLLTVFYQNAI